MQSQIIFPSRDYGIALESRCQLVCCSHIDLLTCEIVTNLHILSTKANRFYAWRIHD